VIYKFKKGTYSYGVDAQTAGEALEKIRTRFGKIETERVVSQAGDPRSVLHPAFEWNDAVAAHQHRLNEARHLVRAITVQETEDDPAEPAFVHVRVDHKGYYQATRVVVKNPDEWDIVRTSALAMLDQAKVHLSTLMQIAEESRTKKAKVKRAQKKIDEAVGELS
jgi:hypothetical protein